MSAEHAPLLIPAPGDRTLATLRRKVGLLAARTLLTLGPEGLERSSLAALESLKGPLAEALRQGGARAVEVFSRPEVLTPLLCLRSGAAAPEPMLRLAMPELLLGLFEAGALREALLWDRPLTQLTSEAGCWRFTSPAQGLSASSQGVELRLADGAFTPLSMIPMSTAFPRIGALPLRLGLADANPLSMWEEHPDKEGNALSLGERPVEAWTEALDAALQAIAAGLPSWSAELPLALRRLVPVGYEPERHLSASYREAPGLAYLTLHPSALTLAEAVVHETQHGKLNLLSWLDPVLENGRTTWTPSPVRPDLRPLMGVMLAAHAFVPVAALHRALEAQGHPLAQGPDFRRRRDEVLLSNARALAVLRAEGRPSPTGARLMSAMEALHQQCCAAAGRPDLVDVPPQAPSLA
ncbi:MAG: hypothetical protein H6741_03210 [Alphaproteobacteria bacterium]|nr:hypothetical protein [Alphaproteobacteria bacterium]